MDEVEDFFDGDFFGDDEDAAVITSKENVPTDEQVLNDLFKKGDKVKNAQKRTRLHPQPKLRENELCGPKGFMELEKFFKDFSPGQGRTPYEDLSTMMQRIEHWGHILYPRASFDDFIARVESLSDKRMIKTDLVKMRLNIPLTDEDFAKRSASAKEVELIGGDEEGNINRFGEHEIVRSPAAAMSNLDHENIDNLINEFYEDSGAATVQTQSTVTSQPSTASKLTEEQRAKIEANRRRAQELRAKREALIDGITNSQVTTHLITEERKEVDPDSCFAESTAPLKSKDVSVAEQPGEMLDDDSALDFIFSSE